MWRCTRYVALHPLRGAAPVTWRCTRTEEVHCLRIGCSAPTYKNKRGTGTPNHSPPHPSMRSWALLVAGRARRPRHHLHPGPLRHLPHPYMRRALKPPDPHREPGPGRVDHLHHHTPVTLSDSAHNPGSQHSDHRTLCRASEHLGCEPRSSDGSPPSRRADHTDHNDQATRSSSRLDETPPGSLTTAGVEVRSSSRTSTSTRNPRPTPSPPHSTRKSHISAGLTNGESMSILINMPTKNIYVSEADMELFERAAQHAESVSAAVVQALREYLTNRHNTEKGYGRIELALYENGSRRKVMFYGREIVRVERPVDGGVQINTIYETAKGQLAVATKIRRLLPDEVKGSYRIWDHPETWSREFWLIGDKTLEVYPDIAQLELVDAYLAEQCKSALSAKPYEVLDI